MTVQTNAKTYNIHEVAALLGCSHTTVRNMVTAGMPFVQEGDGKKTPWLFDMAKVIAWKLDRDGPDSTSNALEEAKTRKMAAEASIQELKLANLRGEVVPIDAVKGQIDEQYSKVRTALLAMPTTLAPVLAKFDDPREVKEILEARIREILNELAGFDEKQYLADLNRSPDSGAEDQPEPSEAPAKTKRSRVVGRTSRSKS